MGKGIPIRPGWTKNVTTLIESGVEVRWHCDTCKQWGSPNLQRIAAEKGADFDLWNREARCRVTPGCKGRVRFLCGGRGMLSPMRD
ncbi:MAG: hypothetical protein ACN4E6_01690 [Qipengyuania pacifica]